jgi:hypothetical protein
MPLSQGIWKGYLDQTQIGKWHWGI